MSTTPFCFKAKVHQVLPPQVTGSGSIIFNLVSLPLVPPAGEEALTMYLAKNKLDRKLVNSTQNVEALHQLASSYFIDRDGTMRKLHEIQISTNAIKVGAYSTHMYFFSFAMKQMWRLICLLCGKVTQTTRGGNNHPFSYCEGKIAHTFTSCKSWSQLSRSYSLAALRHALNSG